MNSHSRPKRFFLPGILVVFGLLVTSLGWTVKAELDSKAIGESAELSQKKEAQQPEISKPIGVLKLEGPIFGGAAVFFLDAVNRAESSGFGSLIVELDTPGGDLEKTDEIVKRILNARIPVILFVSPKGARAASAGVFITMAGHVAAMVPGTRLGAAHPILYSPLDLLPDLSNQPEEEKQKKKKEQEDQRAIMLKKVTEDAVAFIRGIADQRGRNADWAEKAVRESVSLTSDKAVELNVVDLEAENLDDLLEKLHGREIVLDGQQTVQLNTRNAKLERFEMSLRQKLFAFLASPNVFFLLLLIGIGGIAMEFYHPGAILPGAAGALSLLLAAISSQALPLNWGGLLLILVGIGLMIAEVYVTSYGLLGVFGGILLVVGGIFLVDNSGREYYHPAHFQVEWGVLIPMVATILGLFLYIGYHVVRSQKSRIETGIQGMQGLKGEVRQAISEHEPGMVFVRGELWQATSQIPLEKGAKVEVVQVDGLLLRVKPSKLSK